MSYNFQQTFNSADIQNPAKTLGIEVTIPAMAALCGLGNIDPQHNDKGNTDKAAIDAAVTCPMPTHGTTLVTNRPDPDSIGAMAVINLRWNGHRITEDMMDRIAVISKADRFDNGAWPGPRELPKTRAEWVEALGLNGPLPALNAMVRYKWLTTNDKVSLMTKFLKGEFWHDGIYQQEAEHALMPLVDSINDGTTVYEEKDGIATVQSTHPAALTQIGYRLAPVVLACNSQFSFPNGKTGVKYTIAQWDESHINIANVLKSLAKHEEGWGGSPTIAGSPQTNSSKLALHDIASIIKENTI